MEGMQFFHTRKIVGSYVIRKQLLHMVLMLWTNFQLTTATVVFCSTLLLCQYNVHCTFLQCAFYNSGLVFDMLL